MLDDDLSCDGKEQNLKYCDRGVEIQHTYHFHTDDALFETFPLEIRAGVNAFFPLFLLRVECIGV